MTRLCTDCDNCLAVDYGYSNYTVEGTTIVCMKKVHPKPEFDHFYGENEDLKYAEVCNFFSDNFGCYALDVDGYEYHNLPPHVQDFIRQESPQYLPYGAKHEVTEKPVGDKLDEIWTTPIDHGNEVSMFYDRKGQPITLRQWAEYFEDKDYKILKNDVVYGTRICTAWIGTIHNIEQPPLIFATLVENKETDEVNEYFTATEEEALNTHKQHLLRVVHSI